MHKLRLSSWRRSVTQCVFVALPLCAVGLLACKKKPPAPLPIQESAEESAEFPGAASGSAAPPGLSPSPSQGPVATRCRELPHSSPFRIGDVVTPRAGKDNAD